MTLLQGIPRIFAKQAVSVTPVVTANGIYSANDQVGGVMTLTDVIRLYSMGGPGVGTQFGSANLKAVKITDADTQSAAFEIWFFRNSPTMTSIDNGAFNITNANLVLAKYIGNTTIGAAYSSSSSNSVSTTTLTLPVDQISGSSLYAVMKTTGTPTYTTTSALTLTFCFDVD